MRWFPFSSFSVRPVALHMSDHSLALFSFLPDGRVKHASRVVLESGVINDGKVLDAKRLSDAIKKLCAEAKPLALSLLEEVPVVLSIPESRSFTHIFTVPSATPKDESREMVRTKASRLIPMDMNLLYWDWAATETGVGGTDRVLFAAAPKEVVDPYISVCEELNLLPIAIDMETVALSRALFRGDMTPTLIVDIGSRTTNLGFFDDKQRLALSVSIPIAGDSFTEAILARMKISREEAEKMKREQGLDRDIPENRALIILQERLQAIFHEIQKAVQYFETTCRTKLFRVIFAGGSSLTTELVTYFSVNMSAYKVSLGDPLVGFDQRDQSLVEGMAAPIFSAPVIGLARRALSRNPADDGINLLHGWEGERWEAREARILARWKKLAVPLFVASTLLFFYVLYAFLYLPLTRLRTENSSRVTPVAYQPLTETTTIVSPAGKIRITEKVTGSLRVRSGAGSEFEEIAKVRAGEIFTVKGEKDGWVNIELPEDEDGWVSLDYVDKVIEQTP